MMEVEAHPFEPFLPKNARLLMLGTFPPSEKRWSVRFYYPNFINDMWRNQILRRLPLCESIVTAGQLATEIACSQFGVLPPKVGESVPFVFEGRQLRLYRMPSSSRAYPMKLEQKAAYYQKVLLP